MIDYRSLSTLYPRDALGAVCYEALGLAIVGIDPALAGAYRLEGALIAQELGYANSTEPTPVILAVYPELAGEFDDASWVRHCETEAQERANQPKPAPPTWVADAKAASAEERAGAYAFRGALAWRDTCRELNGLAGNQADKEHDTRDAETVYCTLYDGWVADGLESIDWPHQLAAKIIALDVRCATDKATAAAVVAEPVSFDADEWRARCQAFSASAASGCGCADLLYSSRYSGSVDCAIQKFADTHHEEALRIARECGDYVSPGEDDAVWEGCCPHGLDPDCCPVGCGDLPRYSGEDDDWSNV